MFTATASAALTDEDNLLGEPKYMHGQHGRVTLQNIVHTDARLLLH
jgi:hypothetical protein